MNLVYCQLINLLCKVCIINFHSYTIHGLLYLNMLQDVKGLGFVLFFLQQLKKKYQVIQKSRFSVILILVINVIITQLTMIQS